MAWIDSINSKKQYIFKDTSYKGIKDDNGTIVNQMESGKINYLKRWTTLQYDLILQYLNERECVEIIKEVNLSIRDDGTITLDRDKLKTSGLFDFKNDGLNPTFITDPTKLKIKRISGTKYFELTFTLEERLGENDV